MPGKTVDCFVSMLHIPVDECDFGDCPTWGAISPLVFETRNIPKSFQIDGKLTVNSPSKSTIEVNDTDPTRRAWRHEKLRSVAMWELALQFIAGGSRTMCPKIKVQHVQKNTATSMAGSYHARTACLAKLRRQCVAVAQKSLNCTIKGLFYTSQRI